MATLTASQTTDLLGDLGAGALNDVFSQTELQQFYDRAESDYNLAVYYGWRQIAANAAAYVDYKVAQTSVSRSQAFEHIRAMLDFWTNESRVAANQLVSAGIAGVPVRIKPKPADDCIGRRREWRSRWR
jgi:hypothetical protein